MAIAYNGNDISHVYHRKSASDSYAELDNVYYNSNLVFQRIKQQAGRVYVSMWADENNTFPVTFPEPFSEVPVVTFTITNTDSSDNWDHFTVTVESITTTGCVIRVKGDGNGAKGCGGYINWTATI